jgi:exo-1,4-beta-D-glucosaminidase
MQALHSLPSVKLQATCKIEAHGAEKIARVKVTNPTSQMAFFVQLALTQGCDGAEILPVLWDDNYFSLLPGESREVTAIFAAKDAGKHESTLEVGGWNVESDFDCAALIVSPKEIREGKPVTVTAEIANTFLDGSCVGLRLDGEPVAFKWAWARAGRKESLGFPLTLEQSGRHEIAVGGQKISVTVQP